MRSTLPEFARHEPCGGWLSWPAVLLLAVVVGTASGCADGFVPEMRALNPYVRKQWEADEKHGPTYYKRREELRQARAQGPRLPEAEKQRLAKEIIDVLGMEKSPVMRAELVKTLVVFPGP